MRILIGSCGGLTGLYLSKVLREMCIDNNKIEIFGFDTTEEVPTKFFLDHLFIISRASEEHLFKQQLISILNEYKIDIYIPVHSEECRVVAKYQKEILEYTRTKFMISPYDTFKALDDKKVAYDVLNKIGVKTPKLYETYNEINNFPVVAKPRLGSGSKRFFLCNSIDEVEVIKKKYSDLIFMEYIDGTEYTVDAFFNKEGKLVTYNQRVRVKTLGGAAIITKNDFSIDIRNDIEKIALEYKMIGPVNFQFFYTPQNEIIFTDINLRFASGGLPLSIKSGANVIELLIMELLGKKYDPRRYQSDRKRRVMYRYFEEIFEELENAHL